MRFDIEIPSKRMWKYRFIYLRFVLINRERRADAKNRFTFLFKEEEKAHDKK